MITVNRIPGLRGLEALEADLDALVDRDPSASPFHRPQWLIPWWRQFGSGELHALAFRSTCRLVGFIGMFIHEWNGRWQVTLLGTGITDYTGLTAEPEFAGKCTRLTYEYLAGCGDRWEICDWQDLRADSSLIAGAPRDLLHELAPATPCMRVELPADPLAFHQSLPHGLRRTLRINGRRMERAGSLSFETSQDPALVDDLIRLHESRWASHGGPSSMLDQPPAQKVLAEAARGFSRRGRLRMYVMRWNGEPASIICAMLGGGRAWGYVTGMDPELSRYSPGSAVLDYAIRDAIGEGARTWEFLRGDERYKFLWGGQKIDKARLLLRQPATEVPAGISGLEHAVS